MLGLLGSRSDGGLAPSFLVLAALLAAAGTGLLLCPAPGRQVAPEQQQSYCTASSGEAKGMGEECSSLEDGEAAATRRPWQGQQIECQPILPAGARS